MKNKKLILTILGGLLLYLGSTGVSFAAFRFLGQAVEVGPISPLPEAREGLQVDLSQPKTEECPLNGGMFTKDERKIWEKRRPLTVMIENHAEARPQSGLSRADVVYEAVAEGGITRFLAVFYCAASAEDIIIGPVRSARTYFLDFASEYGDYPLYAHVGGANLPGPANALGQIGDYGWLAKGNDLNQFSLGFPTFWRDYERIGHSVATEHTMYSTTDRLWEVAHKRGLDVEDDEGEKWNENFDEWKFEDEADLDERGETEKIDFDFWSNYSEYSVSWQYDRETNLYRRFNNGQIHKDLNNDEQIQAKTVVALLVKEKGPIDELKHLLYTTTGNGKAIVFQNGQAIKGTWQKQDREARTKFLDSRGKEIAFNRGPIWIEVIPAHQEVEY
ncbi:MAG TPA: DUF3048 domain-containing protein [Nevskiaceae bacterium]|nr:DUF3048 domain-containing protein [Nevskiaceae bacterium]